LIELMAYRLGGRWIFPILLLQHLSIPPVKAYSGRFLTYLPSSVRLPVVASIVMVLA
jgi:hypothetical protein